MPSYSLDLQAPPGGEPSYVPAYDFPTAMRTDDQFEYGGYTWQVIAVAIKQFDAPGEPEQTLRCAPV